MVNTLLLIFAPTLATQWDKESDTAMKNHRHHSAFYCHFSGVCSVPGSVLAAVGQAARVSTALPEFTVCWRDQSLHMTLLMWWDYHKGSSHTQLLTVPKSHPMQWVEPCVCVCVCVCALSCISLQPHGLQPTRLLYPWDSPGKNTGVGCHFLLQRNVLYLPHWQADSLPLVPPEKPWVEWWPPTRKHSNRPRNCECDLIWKKGLCRCTSG